MLVFSLSAAAAESKLARFAFTEPHMATIWRVVVYTPDEETAVNAARAAFEEIARFDKMLSDFNEDSELSQLNARAGGEPVRVSAELFELLTKALDISAKTEGAFDVTVGPVVDLWKRAQRRKELPDPAKLAAAQALVGIQNLFIDSKSRTVTLKKSGMGLDLGGIAKGYAVDRALALLKERGIASALVSGGGDIGVSDAPPGETGWKIDIQPLNKGESSPATLLLKNAAVSTSGDAEQHLDTGGKRYSHLVDPKTGKALEGRRSFTVVAPDCTTSDGLAKASVLGAEKALVAIDKMSGVAALYAIEETVPGRCIPFGNGVHAMMPDTYEVKVSASKSWAAVPKERK